MKRIVLVVMAVLVVTGQAWGVDWQQIEKNKSFTGFMDYDTFKFNDKKTEITFWIKNIFGKEFARQISPKKPASHSVQRFTADCINESLYSVEFHIYGKNGAIIASDNQYSKTTMIPGSVNESIYQTACGILASVRMKEEAAAAEQKAAEQAALKKEEEQDRIAEAKNQERLKKEEEQRKEAERKTEGLVVTTANEIRHNGKVIFTDKTATDVNAVKTFTIANKEILLVKFDYKGAECDQKYKYFVAYSHGAVTESDMFGDCRPIGYMLNRGDRIETEFEGNGLPKEKIYFDGSQLTKASPSAGRKAKKSGLGGIFSVFK